MGFGEAQPATDWKTFLANHREVLAAMDFFTVPTASFRLLYVFFVLHHDRRRIVQFGVTEHPTAPWVMQQLRNAFPCDPPPGKLLMDRDSIFSAAVRAMVRTMGTDVVRSAYHSPWQNGAVERFVGTCRRELLDHVIVWNERHLHRLMREFLAYYHQDRTHLALGKDTPAERAVTSRPSRPATIVSLPRVGGLHHRYEWREAA